MKKNIKKTLFKVINAICSPYGYDKKSIIERNKLLHDLCGDCAWKEDCGINSEKERCEAFSEILSKY